MCHTSTVTISLQPSNQQRQSHNQKVVHQLLCCWLAFLASRFYNGLSVSPVISNKISFYYLFFTIFRSLIELCRTDGRMDRRPAAMYYREGGDVGGGNGNTVLSLVVRSQFGYSYCLKNSFDSSSSSGFF